MAVTPSQFELLSKMLSVTMLRHRVISHNVSNVNTPGFHRLEVDFEEMLSSQVTRGTEIDVERVDPILKKDLRGPFRVDGNNVNIVAEMGRLDKNALLHNAYVQILSSKMSIMRRAITGNRT